MAVGGLVRPALVDRAGGLAQVVCSFLVDPQLIPARKGHGVFFVQEFVTIMCGESE